MLFLYLKVLWKLDYTIFGYVREGRVALGSWTQRRVGEENSGTNLRNKCSGPARESTLHERLQDGQSSHLH